MKSGTIFDNFLITDDPAFAKSECENILKTTVKGEKQKKDAFDEEQKKKQEEEAEAEDEDDEGMDEVDEVNGQLTKIHRLNA